MTEETVIDVAPQQVVFLRFERKVSIGYDNVRTFSVSHPVPLSGDNAADAAEIDRVTSLIQEVVLDAVGVEYEVVNGTVVEKAQDLRPAPQPKDSGAAQGVGQTTSVQIDQFGDPNAVEQCPKCGGGMFNNRKDKAIAYAKAKAEGDNAQAEKVTKRPDFKCKNYRDRDGACKGVIWHDD